MSRPLKIIIVIPAVIIAFVSIIILLYWQTNIVTDLSKVYLNEQLRGSAHFEYEEISGDILNHFHIENLKITMTNGIVFRTNHLQIDYSIQSTIGGQYLFNSIEIDSFFVTIPAQPDSLPAEDEPQKMSIEQRLNDLASSVPLRTFIESLPSFKIENLQINYGKADVHQGAWLFDDIELSMSAKYLDNNLELRVEKLCAQEVLRQFELDMFQVQLLGNPKRITLNQLKANTSKSVIEGYADITIGDSLWLIVGFEDTHISLHDIHALSDMKLADSGYVELSLDLVGHPNRFSTKLVSAFQIDDYKIDSLVIDGDYYGGEITLHDGFLKKDSMLVAINGRLGEENSLLDLQFINLNLKALYPQLFPTILNGSLYLDTKYLDDPLYQAAGDIRIYHSTVDTMYLDTLRLAIQAEDHFLQIIKPSFLKLGPGSRFVVEGTLDEQKQVDLQLLTQNHSIQTMTTALRLPEVNGTYDGNFFLSGSVFDPDLEGYLWIPHLEKDLFALDSMILQLNLQNLVSKRQGRGFLMASQLQLDSINVTQTLASVVFDSNRILIDTLLFANKQNYVTTTGFLESRKDTIDLVFDIFRINYGSAWLENDGDFWLRLANEELIIENANFKSFNKGLMEIRGYWDRQRSDMRLGLYLENINFEPFQQFMSGDILLSGTLDADFDLINPITDPQLDVELRAKKLGFNDIQLGDVHCIFQYEKNQLAIQEFKMTNGEAVLDVDGDIAVQWSEGDSADVDILRQSMAAVTLTWKDIEIADYMAPLNLSRPLRGKVSGKLSLTGTVAEPQGNLLLMARNISYQKFRSDSLYLKSYFNKDSLVVDQLALTLNDTKLNGNGWQLIDLDFSKLQDVIGDRPFQINLFSKDNKITFIGGLMDQVERVEGPYEASFQIGGTLYQPALTSGYFRLDNGTLLLSRIKNPITDLSIDAVVENNRLVINSLKGYAEKEKDFWQQTYDVFAKLFQLLRGETRADGGLYGEGTILLDDLMHPRLDLSINTYKLYLDYFVENTDFVITTNNLHIHGQDTLIVDGDITVNEGNYIVDIPKLRKNIYLTQETVDETRPLTWNLNITMPGNFNISSSKLDLLNNFSFEIMGDIRTLKEASKPSMDLTGHLEIISGKYGSWGQTFGIQNGQIDFNDPRVINPDVNLVAEKKSGEYFVELTVNGNLEELRQQVQVKDQNGNYLSNLSDQEVLSLLSLGTLELDDVAGAGSNVISTSVETAIERGAEALTGLDKVDLSLSENLLDIQSMKLNNGLRDASVSLGKYLTSDLYVEYTGIFGSNAVPAPTVSWKPGNQIGIEYRINRNWSVDSYYLRTLKGSNIYRVSLAWELSF